MIISISDLSASTVSVATAIEQQNIVVSDIANQLEDLTTLIMRKNTQISIIRPALDWVGLFYVGNGWGGRIRTYGTLYQKQLPYRLATPQQWRDVYDGRAL